MGLKISFSCKKHPPPRFFYKSQGFTLVELSIVLVVIGLLIGGILVAQSMISTSKIVAVAAQIQQFDAGVMSFKTKYNYLPGDAPGFGGNGDGAISFDPFNNDHQVCFFGCEIGNFWNNISPETYKGYPCQISASPPVIGGINKNVPASKMGKSGSYFVATAISPGSYQFDNVDKRNYYILLDSTQAQTINGSYLAYSYSPTTSANSAVKPAELLALDTKIDNAIANSGNVISGNMESTIGVAAPYNNPLSTCSQTSTYKPENPGYECTPLIRIGAQTGDPQ